MLLEIWDRFEMEIFRNVSIVSGYIFHAKVNNSMEIESDFDVE